MTHPKVPPYFLLISLELDEENDSNNSSKFQIVDNDIVDSNIHDDFEEITHENLNDRKADVAIVSHDSETQFQPESDASSESIQILAEYVNLEYVEAHEGTAESDISYENSTSAQSVEFLSNNDTSILDSSNAHDNTHKKNNVARHESKFTDGVLTISGVCRGDNNANRLKKAKTADDQNNENMLLDIRVPLDTFDYEEMTEDLEFFRNQFYIDVEGERDIIYIYTETFID